MHGKKILSVFVLAAAGDQNYSTQQDTKIKQKSIVWINSNDPRVLSSAFNGFSQFNHHGFIHP
jgi:hypothetical protein